MADEQVREALREAYRLYRIGEVEKAQTIINAVLEDQPKNADAWYIASLTVDRREREIELLQKAVAADRRHLQARAALQRLGIEPPPLPTPESLPTLPTPLPVRDTAEMLGLTPELEARPEPIARPAAPRRPPHKLTPQQQAARRARRQRRRLLFVAGLVLMLIVILILVWLIFFVSRTPASEASETDQIVIPTLRPTPTLMPTATIGPSPTPPPTATDTPPPPFGQTATYQLYVQQTANAALHLTGTAAALTNAPPG